MRNRIAQQRQQEIFQSTADRAAGRERTMLLFSSEQEMNQRIADIGKLPVAQNDTSLQDADGNFYFLVGYSVIGGPDIIP